MKFEDSPYRESLNHYKVEMPFGVFFFCEKFVITEIHAGVHFDWPKIKLVVSEMMKFYEPEMKIGYITNSVNSYSIDPQDWSKVPDGSNIMVASAIVYYNKNMFLNASLEKRFSKVIMQPCQSLEGAFEWILNLEELK